MVLQINTCVRVNAHVRVVRPQIRARRLALIMRAAVYDAGARVLDLSYG